MTLCGPCQERDPGAFSLVLPPGETPAPCASVRANDTGSALVTGEHGLGGFLQLSYVAWSRTVAGIAA